ncbi:uncharacterized protein [Dipodomys merriami]|uniref:uncharacterized protein isoform X3 n=1 Tax=Dipodomys merriami TaxID=94247 RepID=UPI003855A3A1
MRTGTVVRDAPSVPQTIERRIFPWLGLTYYRPKEMNGKLVRKAAGHEEPRILPLDPTSLTPKLDGELVTGNGSLSS